MLTLRRQMRIGVVGTSLTSGGVAVAQPHGWWADPILRCASNYAGPLVDSSGALTPDQRPFVVHAPTLAEIGGAKLADLIAAWGTLITPYAPVDCVLFEGNINDVYNGGGAPTAEATYRAQMQTLFGLAQAAGATQILWLGALLGYVVTGEKPSLFGDAFNTALDDYNVINGEEMATLGAMGTYVDLRPAFKTWETLNNLGDVGTGGLTSDGVHLSESNLINGAESGLEMVSRLVLPYIGFDPT